MIRRAALKDLPGALNTDCRIKLSKVHGPKGLLRLDCCRLICLEERSGTCGSLNSRLSLSSVAGSVQELSGEHKGIDLNELTDSSFP